MADAIPSNRGAGAEVKLNLGAGEEARRRTPSESFDADTHVLRTTFSFDKLPERTAHTWYQRGIQRLQHSWRALPTACRALLVLAVLNAALTIAYAASIYSAGDNGEAVHISIGTVICAFFICAFLIDAVVYENSLEMAAAVIIGSLVLMRVVWFIIRKESSVKLVVLWGVMLCSTQSLVIVFAMLAYRQFGWRVLSHIGVDVRRHGAGVKQRAAVTANAFNTAYRLCVVMAVLLTALGVMGSAERPTGVDVALMVMAIVGLFATAAAVAVVVVALAQPRPTHGIASPECIAAALAASLVQPISVIILYSNDHDQRLFSARVSLNVVAGFSIGSTFALLALYRLASAQRSLLCLDKARFKLRVIPTAATSRNMTLLPLQLGGWLGKPMPKNPGKLRYFQLSHDACTLRWGWNKFVRLYYLQTMTTDIDKQTLTLIFVADAPLTLQFPDVATLKVWHRGLRLALDLALAPEGGDEPDLEREAATDTAPLLHSPDGGRTGSAHPSLTRLARRLAVFLVPRGAEGMGATPASPSPSQVRKRRRLASHLLRLAMGSRRSSLGGTDSHASLGSQESGRAGESMAAVHGEPPAAAAPGERATGTAEADVDAPDLFPSPGLQPPDAAAPSPDRGPSGAGGAGAPPSSAGGAGPPLPAPPQPPLPARDEEVAARYLAAIAAGGLTAELPALTRQPSGKLDESAATTSSRTSVTWAFDPVPSSLSRIPPRGASPRSPPPSLPPPASLPPPTLPVDVVEYGDLAWGRLLGVGSEARVHAARLRGAAVAVKSFPVASDALAEVQMYLAAGAHDNIVGLRGLCRHAGALHLVLEYCPRGTLDVLLHHTARRPWDAGKLLDMVHSVAAGLAHLHARGILHRDLKPANIFVGNTATSMKIGDFGCSRCTQPDLARLTPNVLGTVQYAAPELINEDLLPPPGSAPDWPLCLDIWSLGVVVWEMLSRRRPFEGLPQTAVQARWLARQVDARLPEVPPPGPGTAPEVAAVLTGLARLSRDCMALRLERRPQIGEVLRRVQELRACLPAGAGALV
ncbi:hypothetical protein ACKKBG_A26675 [Auxenochlorella protothecoides x Auxenochlorella symbiontica]